MSVSKEMHAFSKSPRFPSIKINTNNSSSETFNKLTDFDKTVIKGKGKPQHSFGERHRRFSYYADPNTHGKVGPANYKE